MNRVFDLGMEKVPEEACGLLVKESPSSFRVIELRNRADDPTASYRIDPATLRELSLKPEHWSNVIIWHTHPRGHIGPSAGDIEHKIEGVKYAVVTIPTGEVVLF